LEGLSTVSEVNPLIAVAIILVFITVVVLSWFSMAQGWKRSHDVGLSGWWQLIPFYFIYLLVAKGDGGSNRYGLDPKVESDKGRGVN
jgi:uncharacterized membrane protein YhaH (DUF805 family)